MEFSDVEEGERKMSKDAELRIEHKEEFTERFEKSYIE
jgi:hypothetical protein